MSTAHFNPHLGRFFLFAEPLRAKLVEVKGPGDKLSDRQLAWLHLLHTWGVDAEVCYVAANQ
jgi:hypothetical protein